MTAATLDDILVRYDRWSEQRGALWGQETDGPPPRPDEWYWSDDEAVEILELLASAVREDRATYRMDFALVVDLFASVHEHEQHRRDFAAGLDHDSIVRAVLHEVLEQLDEAVGHVMRDHGYEEPYDDRP